MALSINSLCQFLLPLPVPFDSSRAGAMSPVLAAQASEAVEVGEGPMSKLLRSLVEFPGMEGLVGG